MAGFANLRFGLATGGVSFWLSISVAVAVAQECEIRPMTDSGDRTAMAQSNFTCVSSRLSAALSRIEALEADLAAFRAPRGMVVAFDRDKNDPCPKGWKIFEDAGGRFVVGAGSNINKDSSAIDLTDRPALKDDPASAVGGSEVSLLIDDNIPEHDHLVAANNAAAQFLAEQKRAASPSLRSEDGAFGGRALVTGGPSELTTRKSRSPTAFANMPPFVTLYYCAKE
jgi:hypothetical protein